MEIKQVQLPQNSLAKSSFDTIDYFDAYQCKFTTKQNITVDDFIRAFFTSTPKWVKYLFNFRNKIGKIFGLKTPLDKQDKKNVKRILSYEAGQKVGLFNIYERTHNEVLLGEDDKHLDFRASLLLARFPSGNCRFTISTTVKFHNWQGRLYFLPIKPFHKLVVKAMIKSTVLQVLKPE